MKPNNKMAVLVDGEMVEVLWNKNHGTEFRRRNFQFDSTFRYETDGEFNETITYDMGYEIVSEVVITDATMVAIKCRYYDGDENFVIDPTVSVYTTVDVFDENLFRVLYQRLTHPYEQSPFYHEFNDHLYDC